MKKMTEKALSDAFAGESMAHMKYLIFSEIAEEEGNKDIARLFRAIAFAEKVHAKNHLKSLGIIGKTSQNIENAINGERYEVEEMYPVYYETANLQNEESAKTSFRYALEAEKIHVELYKKAKNGGIEGEIYICPICGYTHVGKPPEKCPICKAGKDKFKKF
ncbi:MAG: rubrerythrin family protein [Thermoplasmatales archaeon]|nr:rubrerythrin family protein [Thermoplasmatales archaeon]